MGKAKKNVQEDNYSFVVDLKTVLALKPDQRVKWLSKACRAVAEGEASVKHVFDVLTSKKLAHGMPTKPGQKMFRTLKDNLYLFSEKQQRYLQEESALASTFGKEERSEDEGVGGARGADPVQGGFDGGAGSGGGGGGGGADMAARMEEMMARCRDFVREKASTFDERAQEAQERERQAEEERKREKEAQRQREWDAIDQWHRQLEDWECACMAAVDERFARLQILQRRAEAEAAEAAAAGQATLASNIQANKEKSRKRRSSESSGEDAEVFRSGHRRRSGSRSGGRSRRRRRDASPDRHSSRWDSGGGPAQPPPLSHGIEDQIGSSRSSRRKFTEERHLDPRHRQAEEHAQAQFKVQQEVQKVLGQVAGGQQAGSRIGAPPAVGGTLAEMLRGGGGR